MTLGERIEGTYDVLISADKGDERRVHIDLHELVETSAGRWGPGRLLRGWTREATESEYLLATDGDFWFHVGREATLSDMLDVPLELRRFAQLPYEWARGAAL